MKVLVSAYACEPGQGSEHGAGWAWARGIAASNEVWVLTRTANRAAIEAATAEKAALQIHFVYLDLPAWARRWKRGVHGVHLYYVLWQALAWRAARRLHRQIGFHVAHHVTFATDWLPAGVAWVPNLPLVWGPVGGATSTPWQLWRWLGVRGWCSDILREVVSRPARRVFGDTTARRAALVVALNRDVAARFSFAKSIVIEPNVALDLHERPKCCRRMAAGDAGTRRAVFAGRLVPWKGLRLAIAALAQPDATDWLLDVYGEGVQAGKLAEYANRLHMGDRVELHGARPRREVLCALGQADAMLFPSFHDSSPWAVGEALSMGCPVVCVDRGGPPVLLEGSGGIAVPVAGNMPRRLSAALGAVDAATVEEGRWSAARLPALTDRWYAIATGAHAEVD